MRLYDTGAQIDMAISDFSTAFDTVPHGKLLHKMNMYGVDGTLNNWLRDFLTNRSMGVVVGGEVSDCPCGIWGPTGDSTRSYTVPVS